MKNIDIIIFCTVLTLQVVGEIHWHYGAISLILLPRLVIGFGSLLLLGLIAVIESKRNMR